MAPQRGGLCWRLFRGVPSRARKALHSRRSIATAQDQGSEHAERAGDSGGASREGEGGEALHERDEGSQACPLHLAGRGY